MPLTSNYFPQLAFKIRAKNIQYIDYTSQTEDMCVSAAFRITSFDFLIKNVKNMSKDVADAIWVNILNGKYSDVKTMSDLGEKIYNPMEELPNTIYEMYFEHEGMLQKNKHQSQIMCDAAYKVNADNLCYMKPEFRKKEMYDNLYKRFTKSICVHGIGMPGLYIPPERIYFNLSKYFKNEFNILIDTYYEHDGDSNSDNIKIYVYPRKDNNDTMSYLGFGSDTIEKQLKKMNPIEITMDELYESNKDKNVILGKFEHLKSK